MEDANVLCKKVIVPRLPIITNHNSNVLFLQKSNCDDNDSVVKIKRKHLRFLNSECDKIAKLFNVKLSELQSNRKSDQYALYRVTLDNADCSGSDIVHQIQVITHCFVLWFSNR